MARGALFFTCYDEFDVLGWFPLENIHECVRLHANDSNRAVSELLRSCLEHLVLFCAKQVVERSFSHGMMSLMYLDGSHAKTSKNACDPAGEKTIAICAVNSSQPGSASAHDLLNRIETPFAVLAQRLALGPAHLLHHAMTKALPANLSSTGTNNLTIAQASSSFAEATTSASFSTKPFHKSS